MHFPLFPKKKEKEKGHIGTQEADSLWRVLANKYYAIDHLNHLGNFAHDNDFKLLLRQHIASFEKEANMLEKLLDNFSIKSPEPNIRDVNVTGNFEVVRDQETAKTLHFLLERDADLLVQALSDSTYNDQVRSFFINLTGKAFERLDNYIKYIKLKGWLETPPLYPYVDPQIPDKISVSEIYDLWQHLIFRYTQIRMTKITSTFAHDNDFKIVLESGINVLEKQANSLEKKLLHFGANLPRRYPKATPTPETGQWLTDKFMYNFILQGMMSASAVHGLAIKRSTFNDSIRLFFKDLVLSEIDLVDKMVRFGKIKGWLSHAPSVSLAK